MRIFYYLLSLVPVAFLFHYYEYGQHLKGESSKFLFPLWLLYIVITGLLAFKSKKRTVLMLQVISCIISILLAKQWIVNDGSWFKPVSRDSAVVWIASITFIGQLIVRTCMSFIAKYRLLVSQED